MNLTQADLVKQAEAIAKVIDEVEGKNGAGPTPPGDAEPTRKKMRTVDYIAALGKLGYTFALNKLDETVNINGEPATDALETKIRTQLRDIGHRRVNVARDAYIANAFDNSFNPITDYFDALKWDGTQRVGRLAAHFDIEGGDFGKWLQVWLLGAVAKVYRGHQNPMLVLSSKIRRDATGAIVQGQGLGKSYFAKWLCSGLSNHFISKAINPEDKDDKKRLINHFIWEVDELGSTTRKRDIEALKSFITTPLVIIRPAYGKNDIRKKPVASFIGTVNDDGIGFLPDTTGNRRFITLEVKAIDWAYTAFDVNQIWAEAKVMFDAGVSCELDQAMQAEQAEKNMQHIRTSLVGDAVLRHYELTNNPADIAQTLDIVTTITDAEDIRDTQRFVQMEVAKFLGSQGLTKKVKPSRWLGIRRKRGA